MNVLSLFDGMSCGQLALQRAGIQVNNYFAAEIDKYAIKVTQANFPGTTQLGDVTTVDPDKLPKIDLLIGGSPCQGFSFAGKQLNFDDPRSKLFWEYVRLLKALKPKYFLLVNVKMKKESMDVITKALGVEPIFINSSRVSAQNRQRYYWTNIPMYAFPEDKGIVLADILEDGHVDRDKSHCIDANYFKGGNLKSYFEKHRRQLVFSKDGMCHVGDADISDKYAYVNRVYHPDGKGPSLVASDGGHLQPKISKGTTEYRNLTPLECERLQTLPDGYTQYGDFGGEQFDKDGNFVRYTTKPISNTQRYKMIGNGMTVSIIARILEGMEI